MGDPMCPEAGLSNRTFFFGGHGMLVRPAPMLPQLLLWWLHGYDTTSNRSLSGKHNPYVAAHGLTSWHGLSDRCYNSSCCLREWT